MLRSRRFALVATAVIIGLSACGNGGDTTSVGKNPAVIVLGAGSGSKVAGPNVATGEAAGDMMIAPWSVTYEWVGGAYPDLGTSGPSWSLPAGTSVDKAVVAKLAAALGVTGDVRAVPADQGGGWMVGPADYSGPTVQVSSDGMLSWWYNGPVTAVKDVGCAVPGEATTSSGGGTDSASGAGAAPVAPPDTALPPDTVVVEPCRVDAPTPPANLPDKAGAEAATKAFLAEIGLDASKFEFTSYADEWSASTTAFLQLGGHRSQIQINLGFGENGVISWASGSLATPQAGAEYPIVGPAEALTRLQDQTGKWFGYGGGVGIARMAGGVADSAVDSVTVSAGSAVAEPALGAPEVAPAPVTSDNVLIDPMPTPEPVVVQLNAVRLDLTMVWAADGTVWLLPAYTFTSTDGGEYTVIAVEDQYVQTPDTTTPVPGTDGSVTPDTAVPPPATDPGSNPVATDPVSIPDPIPADVAAKALTGLSVDEATKVAEGNGWSVRVSTLDGEAQMLTDDYSPTRVNVVVTAGVVTGVDSIG